MPEAAVGRMLAVRWLYDQVAVIMLRCVVLKLECQRTITKARDHSFAQLSPCIYQR